MVAVHTPRKVSDVAHFDSCFVSHASLVDDIPRNRLDVKIFFLAGRQLDKYDTLPGQFWNFEVRKGCSQCSLTFVIIFVNVPFNDTLDKVLLDKI